MQLYKRNAKGLTVGGVTYPADNGFVDVPDDKLDSSVWTQGFVIGAPVVAALDAEQAKADAEATQATKPAVAASSTGSTTNGSISGATGAAA